MDCVSVCSLPDAWSNEFWLVDKLGGGKRQVAGLVAVIDVLVGNQLGWFSSVEGEVDN